MANFHFGLKCISRRKGQSVIGKANYQSGERLRDNYYGKTYYHRRSDVLHAEILLPPDAPKEFLDRQTLWREVDRVEKRSDARTARKVIVSLPNELTRDEQIELVRDYVSENFVSMGMCADIAVHEVKNKDDPARNNPHAHILLTTRLAEQNGFCPKKNREWDRRENVTLWREHWAEAQNRVYERKGLDVRVTDKSYREREIFDREPKRYLCRGDMYLERKGIRTIRGDENRDIEARNKERERQEHERVQKRERDRDRGRSR